MGSTFIFLQNLQTVMCIDYLEIWLFLYCSDFTVSGGGDDKSVKQNGTDTSSQSAARMELEQLKLRVAELEAQLGARKKQGLKFTVSPHHSSRTSETPT